MVSTASSDFEKPLTGEIWNPRRDRATRKQSRSPSPNIPATKPVSFGSISWYWSPSTQLDTNVLVPRHEAITTSVTEVLNPWETYLSEREALVGVGDLRRQIGPREVGAPRLSVSEAEFPRLLSRKGYARSQQRNILSSPVTPGVVTRWKGPASMAGDTRYAKREELRW